MGWLRIGLTGGIGSGKSTVAAMLSERGVTLIDTDAIARALTGAGGAAIVAIRAAFGDDAIAADGSMDRPRMRAAAFVDVACRRRLEDILHPLIAVEVERQQSASTTPVDVLDIRFSSNPAAGGRASIASGSSTAANRLSSLAFPCARAGRPTWPATSSRSKRAGHCGVPPQTRWSTTIRSHSSISNTRSMRCGASPWHHCNDHRAAHGDRAVKQSSSLSRTRQRLERT